MTQPTDFIEQLAALAEKATKEELRDGGRYFAESYMDLTRCNHGETGEYVHRADGELIELLWNHRHAILALGRENAALRHDNAAFAASVVDFHKVCNASRTSGEVIITGEVTAAFNRLYAHVANLARQALEGDNQ